MDGMTVKQLIEKLSEIDPNLVVTTGGKNCIFVEKITGVSQENFYEFNKGDQKIVNLQTKGDFVSRQ